MQPIIFIVVSQSVFNLIILTFVIIKMSQIIINQKKAEKDIDELWKTYRLFKSMIYGNHNRFVSKIELVLSKNDIHTDFSNVFLKDE